MTRSDGGGQGGVQSIGRAFQLLDAMSEAGGEMSISEMAGASGLPLPTIHRIVRTLLDSGHVHQLANRRYTLGPRLISLGEGASRMLGAWARPALTQLAEDVGETTNMALLDGERAVYVAQIPSRHAMRMFTEVGRRVHLHSTGVGKALLAQLPAAAVRRILAASGTPPMTSHTITDVEELLDELEKVRQLGHAVDDEEQETGVRCVAVAVPGTPSPTAVSVSGPTNRLTHTLVGEAVPRLRATATRVAEHFGRGH